MCLTIDIVRELFWFNIRQRSDYFTALLVCKSLNGMSPDYMSDLFTYTHEIGAYNTRSTAHKILYVPKVNRHIFAQSIQ